MLQERNDRGIQLIERNEETAIFYERLNVQDAVLRKGISMKHSFIAYNKMSFASLIKPLSAYFCTMTTFTN